MVYLCLGEHSSKCRTFQNKQEMFHEVPKEWNQNNTWWTFLKLWDQLKTAYTLLYITIPTENLGTLIGYQVMSYNP
jgi:hypothetical protein